MPSEMKIVYSQFFVVHVCVHMELEFNQLVKKMILGQMTNILVTFNYILNYMRFMFLWEEI